MCSLKRQTRIDDLSATVDEMRRSGYALGECWNQYVQTLARNNRGVLAFETCERELMDDWPGWISLGFTSERKPNKLGRMMPKHRALRSVLTYDTFVYLAKVHLGMGSQKRRELLEAAPGTTDAVCNMPPHPRQERISGPK